MAYAIVWDYGEDLGKGALGVVSEKIRKRAPALEAFERTLKLVDTIAERAKEKPTATDETVRRLQEAARLAAEKLTEMEIPRVYLAHGPRHVFQKERPVAKADCWDWRDRDGKEHRNDG